MYYDLPTDPKKAKPILQRFMRENIGASQEMLAIRRRPLPPRDIIVTAGTGLLTISWIGPQNMAGVAGFNLYQGSETNLIQNIVAQQFPNDPNTGGSGAGQLRYQAKVTNLASNVKVGFFLSAYSALLESIKVPLVGTPS